MKIIGSELSRTLWGLSSAVDRSAPYNPDPGRMSQEPTLWAIGAPRTETRGASDGSHRSGSGRSDVVERPSTEPSAAHGICPEHSPIAHRVGSYDSRAVEPTQKISPMQQRSDPPAFSISSISTVWIVNPARLNAPRVA